MRPAVFILLALVACSSAGVAPSTTAGAGDARFSGTFAGGWRFPEAREASFGEQTMVASNSNLASEAGVEILKAGGNAVDAAVAVQLVLGAGASVAGAAFAIELGFLNGRAAMADVRVTAVVTYP